MTNFKVELNRPFAVYRDGYGGNQMWFVNQRSRNTGCGSIALANLWAYHRGLSLSREDFLDLQKEANQALPGPVVAGVQFLRGLNKFLKGKKVAYDAKVYNLGIGSGRTPSDLLKIMAKSLAQDRPLPLLLGPNRRGKQSYMNSFANHWVLVTGLFEKEDSPYLKVSSWGQAYDLDFFELVQSKLFLSLVDVRIK